EFMLALTPALSPGERENCIQSSGNLAALLKQSHIGCRNERDAGTFKPVRFASPSPRGEGWGEGSRSIKPNLKSFAVALLFLFSTHFASAENLLLKNAIVHPVSTATITNGEVFVQNGKIIQVFDGNGRDRKLL